MLLAIGVLAGCEPDADDDPSTQDDESDDDSDDESGGDSESLVGSFQLQLAEPDTASLVGKIYDGPTPRTLIWEPSLEAGACRLSTPRVPFCSVACGGSAACVEDETCQAYPNALSVGEVLVSGVTTSEGETSFTMTPIADNYQVPAGTALAYPPFTEGDTVALAAEGDELAGFELAAAAIAPLELATDQFELDPAADLLLEWTAGGANSKILVELDISHHAGTKGMIECETDDVGSLAIPAAMVAALLDLGVAGYPTIIVTRESKGSAPTTAGRVELVISSKVERAVVIAGLVSCTDDADCPEAQTCQPNLMCQ
ncbi:hypothetical protein ACNOYE_14450 [Nannocystaceae bacterium ST9]